MAIHSPSVVPVYVARYIPGASVEFVAGNGIMGRAGLAVHGQPLPELAWNAMPLALAEACLGYRVKMKDALNDISAQILRCPGDLVKVRELSVQLPLATVARFGFPLAQALEGTLHLQGQLDVDGDGNYRAELNWTTAPRNEVLEELFTGLGAHPEAGRWHLRISTGYAPGA